MAGGKSGVARAVAGAVLAVAAGAAHAESRLELTTTLAVSASDNPLLRRGGKSALLAEGTVNPSWVLRDGISTTRLEGTLTVRRYSREYEKYTYGSAKLEREGQLSEAFSYSGALSYDRSVTVDVVDDVAAAVDPSSLRNQLAAEAAIRWRPGLRGEVSAGAGYERSSFEKATVLSGYRALDLYLGYSYPLSDATRLGARATARFNRSKSSSDINVQGLTAQLEHRFGPVWVLTASAGAEHVKPVGARLPVGRAVGGTFASGDVKLCRKSERLDLCGSVELSTQASGLGTVQRRLSFETSASYRLSERTTLSLAGNYERPVGSSTAVGVNADPRYLQLRADIGRRISETLTLRAYGSYRRRQTFDTIDAGYVGVDLRWTPRLS